VSVSCKARPDSGEATSVSWAAWGSVRVLGYGEESVFQVHRPDSLDRTPRTASSDDDEEDRHSGLAAADGDAGSGPPGLPCLSSTQGPPAPTDGSAGGSTGFSDRLERAADRQTDARRTAGASDGQTDRREGIESRASQMRPEVPRLRLGAL
jgi:hypothetical protein